VALAHKWVGVAHRLVVLALVGLVAHGLVGLGDDCSRRLRLVGYHMIAVVAWLLVFGLSLAVLALVQVPVVFGL